VETLDGLRSAVGEVIPDLANRRAPLVLEAVVAIDEGVER
jgi:hypothetical protein